MLIRIFHFDADPDPLLIKVMLNHCEPPRIQGDPSLISVSGHHSFLIWNLMRIQIPKIMLTGTATLAIVRVGVKK
jgi:hypothetical protein